MGKKANSEQRRFVHALYFLGLITKDEYLFDRLLHSQEFKDFEEWMKKEYAEKERI